MSIDKLPFAARGCQMENNVRVAECGCGVCRSGIVKPCKELRDLDYIEKRLTTAWAENLVAYDDVRGAQRERAAHVRAALRSAGVIQ